VGLEVERAELVRRRRDADRARAEILQVAQREFALTFDHHDAHQDFIKLFSIENIHRAEHLRQSEALVNLAPVTELISRILEAGRAGGDFVAPAAAIDVHMMISSFCFFRP
jgi:hypothetical protein